MKLFECQACGQPLYFENNHCESCTRPLGFLPDVQEISALEPDDGQWKAWAAPEERYRFCANAEHNACNWLVPNNSPDRYCRACRHNRTVPDLSSERNVSRWRNLEVAKRRLFYTLLKLGLPLTLRPEATAGIVRAMISNGLLHNQRHRVWCAGPMFRHEKPQRGRFRQFHQLDVEAFGDVPGRPAKCAPLGGAGASDPPNVHFG